jgi:hypothetical protein
MSSLFSWRNHQEIGRTIGGQFWATSSRFHLFLEKTPPEDVGPAEPLFMRV